MMGRNVVEILQLVLRGINELSICTCLCVLAIKSNGLAAVYFYAQNVDVAVYVIHAVGKQYHHYFELDDSPGPSAPPPSKLPGLGPSLDIAEFHKRAMKCLTMKSTGLSNTTILLMPTTSSKNYW